MLGDDLQQHLPGQVVAALGVADLEVLAIDDQLADILDGDVARNVGVVEATVRIFLDDARLGHGAKALTDASLQHGAVQHGLQEAAILNSVTSRIRRAGLDPPPCRDAGTAGRRDGGSRPALLTTPCRSEEHTSELQSLMRI